jgi:hypothetical protein
MLTSLAFNTAFSSSSHKHSVPDQIESIPLLASTVEEKWVIIQVPSTGLRHFTGISSSYSTQYPQILQDVISQKEFVDIIERLNETIRDYWPCDTCYYFGYGCSLCTLGLSLLLPHYCASHSEIYATAMLRNVTLKSKFYDRRISFHLVKKLCQSFVEVKVPMQYISSDVLVKHNHGSQFRIITTTTHSIEGSDVEKGVLQSPKGQFVGVSDTIDRSPGNGIEIGPFVRPPSAQPQSADSLFTHIKAL